MRRELKMWPQSYTPVADSLGLSALVAALPIFTLLFLLGVLRKPAWLASTAGLLAAVFVLANTAPVAFGSIGIPIATLAVTTGLPIDRLSAGVGRICAPISLFIPSYLVAVMSGWSGLRSVLPAAAACGIAFAGTQFF